MNGFMMRSTGLPGPRATSAQNLSPAVGERVLLQVRRDASGQLGPDVVFDRAEHRCRLLVGNPSNTSLISSGVSTLGAKARVVRSASVDTATCVSSTSSRSTCHRVPRRERLVRHHVANPSFSQMSSHHFIVTRSPNHWWAISCEMIGRHRLARAERGTLRIGKEVLLAELMRRRSPSRPREVGHAAISSWPNWRDAVHR